MKKETYKVPAVREVEIKVQRHLLAGSEFSNGINPMNVDTVVDGDDAFN